MAVVSLFPGLSGNLCHGSLTSTPPHSCPPLPCFLSSSIPLSLTIAPPHSLFLFVDCFSNLPSFFFSLLLPSPSPPSPPLPPLPSLPLSCVCSRVMVCCGLPTQRNNISGVGKVQPHMSCAAEGRLCEVRPIPHGSYSSQPRDQRPAISLPSSSSSSASSSSSFSSHHH